MEENQNSTHEKEVDNLVDNYLDDIFNSTSEKLKNDNTPENKDLEDLSKNLVNDVFKISLDGVKAKEKTKKKKKKKTKKYRLKTLHIDAKIDVIDEEDSEDCEDKIKIKNEENKKEENEKEEIKKEEIKKEEIKKEVINEKGKIEKKGKKSRGHRKSNSMDLISENVVKKISNNKKLTKKLQLIRPPPSNEINDDFYLNKYINNHENKSNDELCIIF